MVNLWHIINQIINQFSEGQLEEKKKKLENIGSEIIDNVFIYIFFENIWIAKNIHNSEKNDMFTIYSEAEEKFYKIFKRKTYGIKNEKEQEILNKEKRNK